MPFLFLMTAFDQQKIISHLAQFVSQHKQDQIDKVLAKRTRHIAVVLEDVYQPHNASAVIRSCECFGIQDIHVIEKRNKFVPHKEITMGSNKWITLKIYPKAAGNVKNCIKDLKTQGYRIVDNVTITANEEDDTFTVTIPIPHFTRLYVTTGLGSNMQVLPASVVKFVGESEDNDIKFSFANETFAEATYPDGKVIRSEVTKTEVTAITIVDKGPTTTTHDLTLPIVFNNVGDEEGGTLTTTCDAAGNGTVDVSATIKHTITITATPGATTTRTVTRTITQTFPTTCKAKVVVPKPVIGICIHLRVVVGGCLEIGTTVFVTLDPETGALRIVGIGDTSISLNLTDAQLSGSTSVQITGVSFFGLAHTLNLFLIDGVPTGFSLNEEGGTGQCTEEVFDEEEQEDTSSCEI